jgi:hypothetical protein
MGWVQLVGCEDGKMPPKLSTSNSVNYKTAERSPLYSNIQALNQPLIEHELDELNELKRVVFLCNVFKTNLLNSFYLNLIFD